MDFNLIITGTKKFTDYDLLVEKCDQYISLITDVDIHILTGDDGDCEAMVQRYAEEKGYPVTIFELNKDKYGTRAASIRNNSMVSNAHSAICFWDGKSAGARITITACKSKGIPCKIVRFDKIKKEEE